MINLFINPVAAAMSQGGGLLAPLYWVFGKCMEFLLQLLGNQYFVAIIIFTVVTRVILLPINVRQQKTVAKTARLQPKIQKIQKKYPDPKDRMKLNEEMQELYAREGHNPMQMGCGPMVFQMVFLMGIIGIIYYPLSYIIGMSDLTNFTEELTAIMEGAGYSKNYLQLNVLAHWTELKDTLVAQLPALFTDDKVAAIEEYRQGLYLGNVDMTAIPTWKGGSIILIPIFAFLTSMASTVISTLIQKKNNPAQAKQMGSMLMMMLMMPFFSLYIAFKVPAAVGFYWIISNVVAVLQQLFIAKFYPPKKSQAKLMVENTIERRAREESIKRTK